MQTSANTISLKSVYKEKTLLEAFFSNLNSEYFYMNSDVAIWTEVPKTIRSRCGVECVLTRSRDARGEFKILFNPYQKTKEQIIEEKTFYFDENEIVG